MVDLKNDPAYNDDSQPSVTTSAEALRLADEFIAGPLPKVLVRAPADAMDMEHRVAKAETGTSEELARLGAVSAPEPIAEATGSVTSVDEGTAAGAEQAAQAAGEDVGAGPYEGRTAVQLKALAASRGLSTSGSKDELIERLRG